MDKKYISIASSWGINHFSLTIASGFLAAVIFSALQGCTRNIEPGNVPVENRTMQANSKLSVDRSASVTDHKKTSSGSKVYPGPGRSRKNSLQDSSPLITGRLTLELEKDYQAGSALASLLEESDLKVKAGRLNIASSLLERALRIEPKNALVWHKLAGVRFKQKRWKLAESLAQKSNLFSANDFTLKMYNWHLIASTRNKRGDSSGARKATLKAEQIAVKK